MASTVCKLLAGFIAGAVAGYWAGVINTETETASARRMTR